MVSVSSVGMPLQKKKAFDFDAIDKKKAIPVDGSMAALPKKKAVDLSTDLFELQKKK